MIYMYIYSMLPYFCSFDEMRFFSEFVIVMVLEALVGVIVDVVVVVLINWSRDGFSGWSSFRESAVEIFIKLGASLGFKAKKGF